MSEVAKVLPFTNNTVTPSCLPDGGRSSSGGGGSSSANCRQSINSAITTRRMETLKSEYQEAFGCKMPISLYKQIRMDIAFGGVEWRYYLYAIREASLAPRPSWFYARAVLRRVIEDKPFPLELCPEACEDGSLIDFEAMEE